MNSGSVGETAPPVNEYSRLRFWSLFIAGLSIIDLLITLVFVTIHAASPSSLAPSDLAPFVYILAGGSAISTALGVLWFLLRYPTHRKVIFIVLALTLGIMVAHLYTINSPPTSQCYGSSGVQGCVMDEIYYVPAAQALLSGEKCGPYLDNCNLEHPFLSKAIIAAGIALFGDNDFGWRFFVGLLGTACIPILFMICYRFTKDTFLSLTATTLLAFETLFFVQSSIAVIDIQMIFFALLAFAVYLWDVHFWILDKYILAGLLLGLSLLSKEIGVFMFAFLVFYDAVFGNGGREWRIRLPKLPQVRPNVPGVPRRISAIRLRLDSVKMFVVAVVIFCAGLQVYDSLFGNAATSTFIADIHYILSYGASLKGPGWSLFGGSGPPYITPLEWFLYYYPVSYDVIRVGITATTTEATGAIVTHVTSYVSVGYFGVPDLFESWFVWIWVPYVAYLAYKRWWNRSGDQSRPVQSSPESGEPPSPAPSPDPSPASESPPPSSSMASGLSSAASSLGARLGLPVAGMSYDPGVQYTLEGTPVATPEAAEEPAYHLARFALVWFVFTYVPFILLFIYGRVTYPYYVLSTDPALAIGMAYVMTRRWFPREVLYILIGGVIGWFIVFYPDKSFLPVWIRSLLGH